MHVRYGRPPALCVSSSLRSICDIDAGLDRAAAEILPQHSKFYYGAAHAHTYAYAIGRTASARAFHYTSTSSLMHACTMVRVCSPMHALWPATPSARTIIAVLASCMCAYACLSLASYPLPYVACM